MLYLEAINIVINKIFTPL